MKNYLYLLLLVFVGCSTKPKTLDYGFINKIPQKSIQYFIDPYSNDTISVFTQYYRNNKFSGEVLVVGEDTSEYIETDYARIYKKPNALSIDSLIGKDPGNNVKYWKRFDTEAGYTNIFFYSETIYKDSTITNIYNNGEYLEEIFDVEPIWVIKEYFSNKRVTEIINYDKAGIYSQVIREYKKGNIYKEYFYSYSDLTDEYEYEYTQFDKYLNWLSCNRYRIQDGEKYLLDILTRELIY